MTQYPVVLTISTDFTPGHSDLTTAVYAKAKQMTLEGKMAKGTLRQAFPSFDHVPDDYMFSDVYNPTPHFATADDIEKRLYGPLFTNRTMRRDDATKIVYITMPDGEYKGVRVFKTQADAEEYIEFVYSLGAVQSRIMTEQDIDNLGLTWPDDSVIATYFV
jgi:hypothetical protein